MARNCTGPCPSTGAVVKLYSVLKLLAYTNNTEHEHLSAVSVHRQGVQGSLPVLWGCCDIFLQSVDGVGWGVAGWNGMLLRVLTVMLSTACLLHFDRRAVQRSRTVGAIGIAEGTDCLISHTQGAGYTQGTLFYHIRRAAEYVLLSACSQHHSRCRSKQHSALFT